MRPGSHNISLLFVPGFLAVSHKQIKEKADSKNPGSATADNK